jgi:hypothetical protein
MREVPRQMKMKPKRFWIETLALGTAVACALALLIATLAAGTTAVAERTASPQSSESQASDPVTQPAVTEPANDPANVPQHHFEGMVTCSRCGAKHSPKLGKPATECTIICVRGGATFSLVDGDNTYQLDGDLNLLKRLAGQRAQVIGVMRRNTITVSSIAAGS